MKDQVPLGMPKQAWRTARALSERIERTPYSHLTPGIEDGPQGPLLRVCARWQWRGRQFRTVRAALLHEIEGATHNFLVPLHTSSDNRTAAIQIALDQQWRGQMTRQ